MPPPSLFRPLKLRKLVLPNRIAVAPMCQYHAVDGLVQPWHEQHYGALSVGGAGLIVLEATGGYEKVVLATLAGAGLPVPA